MAKAPGIRIFAKAAVRDPLTKRPIPKNQGGAVYKGPQYGTGHQPKQGAPAQGPSKAIPEKPSVNRNPYTKSASNASRVAAANARAAAQTKYGENARAAASTAKGGGKSGGSTPASGTDISNMTPAQIVAQAKSTVGAEYKSSYGDLNSQSKQEQGIAAKQAQDNKAYEAWVGAQTQAILASGAQADATFSAQQASANATIAQSMNPGQSDQAVASADERQGNVSNNVESTPLTTDLIAKQNLDKVNQANVDKAAISSVETSSDLLKSSALNAESGVGNAITSQRDVFDQSMAKIAQAKQNLNLNNIGDIAKEVARLQGVQVQVQAAAAQNAIAEQAYGLNAKTEADQHATDIAKIAATIKIGKMDAQKYFAGLSNARVIAKYEQMGENARANLAAQTQMSEAELRNALGNKQFELDRKKLGLAQAAQNWKEAHPNAGSSSGPNLHPDGSPLTVSEEQAKYDTISQTTALINHYLTLYHGKVPDPGKKIYQTLLSGGQLQTGGTASKPVYTTVSPVAKALLNAAFTMSQARNGVLTPGEIAALRNIGLRNVTTHVTR